MCKAFLREECPRLKGILKEAAQKLFQSAANHCRHPALKGFKVMNDFFIIHNQGGTA